MGLQECKKGKYDAFTIRVPGCAYRAACIERYGLVSRFCPCLVRVGGQELDNNVKVYCDWVGPKREDEDAEG